MANLFLTGSGVPTNAVGEIRDYYRDTTTNLIYYRAALGWEVVPSLVPTPDGVGTTWLYGTGAPLNGLGSDGNYYFDNDVNTVYFKVLGAWQAKGSLDFIGVYGVQWGNGTGAPANIPPLNNLQAGSFYLDVATSDIYYKNPSLVWELKGQLGGGGATTASTTDTVTEGSTNLYFTDARVRNTVLSGLSLVTNAAISASDSVLGALGKLQKQITDILTNQRYVFVTDPNPTYTVPASAVTANGNTIIELSNNSLTSITINTSTSTGKTAGDSVTIQITGTYAAQLLVASGVTLNGTLAFSENAKIKTLIYRGSNTWTILGG